MIEHELFPAQNKKLSLIDCLNSALLSSQAVGGCSDLSCFDMVSISLKPGKCSVN